MNIAVYCVAKIMTGIIRWSLLFSAAVLFWMCSFCINHIVLVQLWHNSWNIKSDLRDSKKMKKIRGKSKADQNGSLYVSWSVFLEAIKWRHLSCVWGFPTIPSLLISGPVPSAPIDCFVYHFWATTKTKEIFGSLTPLICLLLLH